MLFTTHFWEIKFSYFFTVFYASHKSSGMRICKQEVLYLPGDIPGTDDHYKSYYFCVIQVNRLTNSS